VRRNVAYGDGRAPRRSPPWDPGEQDLPPCDTVPWWTTGPKSSSP